MAPSSSAAARSAGSASGTVPVTRPSAAKRRKPRRRQPKHNTEFERILHLLSQLANPSAAALKAGDAFPLYSFPNMVARLCFFSASVKVLERHNVLRLIHSEEVQGVASYIFGKLRFPGPDVRLQVTKDFNDLVKEVLRCFDEWLASWNAVPNHDLPVTQAMQQLRSQAVSAPAGPWMDWSLVIFVFGEVPELWGLGTRRISDNSAPNPPGVSIGGTVNASEIMEASVAEPEEHSALADDEAMEVDHAVLAPAIGSSGNTYPPPLAPVAPRTQTSTSVAGISAMNLALSQPGDIEDPMDLGAGFEAEFLNPTLIAFLSAFRVPKLLPVCELSTLLNDTMYSKAMSKAAPDCAELKEVTTRKIHCLHQFAQAHREHLQALLGLVRSARQRYTWTLEVQLFYKMHGVELSPAFRIKQGNLSTFVDGFMIFVYQLLQQQKDLSLPEL